MTWSALPEHLNSPEKWAGTDDSKVAWMNWRLKVKGWFAYGPRATQWWAKWHTPPKCLFKLGGDGAWRYETDPMSGRLYLSRIQYWKRWHVAIQWPFFIQASIYPKKEDTMPFGDFAGSSVDKKVTYAYLGCSYDQDGVYWFPSGFIGKTWK
mgnify:CR=1 FL=1